MKKWKRAVTLLLVFVLFIISSLTVYATSSTSDMIKQKEQEKKDTESDLQDTKDQIDDLKNQKGGLETDLNNLNSERSKVNDKIEELSTQITSKEEEIRVTQEELEAARPVSYTHLDRMQRGPRETGSGHLPESGRRASGGGKELSGLRGCAQRDPGREKCGYAGMCGGG